MNNNKHYCIKEYGYFASDKYTKKVKDDNILLPDNVFTRIENYLLREKPQNLATIDEFITISYRRNEGKILRVNNYVGVIKVAHDITIEILPKIFVAGDDIGYKKTREIFLQMLRFMDDLPMKTTNIASLQTDRLNIMDIFILMFLRELSKVIKQGIKSSYVSSQDNLRVYRGKLLVNKHIIENSVHRDRFYMGYEEFSTNIPENRIIKTTLLFLKGQTNNVHISRMIAQYLLSFLDVDVSTNYEKDFSNCVNNRLMSQYDNLIKWCRVFLGNQSFTNYSGEDKAYSLLFPMESVFESYVAKCIIRSRLFKDFQIHLQHRKHYLLESNRRFRLIPDILMENKHRTIIMDTKWKLLYNRARGNSGISQDDLYQMYAYAKKYNSNQVILIYPRLDDHRENESYYFEEGHELIIFFIDLENIHEGIKDLREKIVNHMDLSS